MFIQKFVNVVQAVDPNIVNVWTLDSHVVKDANAKIVKINK